MTLTVDLFDYAKSNNSKQGHIWSKDAATFMEILKTPRVLADSQFYLAYTMKKSYVLRVVQRSNILKGSLRVHTKPIQAVKFVNYRSNVAASAGEGEFFVWVVTDQTEGIKNINTEPRLTINVYFKLQDPVTILCFSFFINAENQRPDLLILYNKEVAIFESSSLIYQVEAKPLEATLQGNSTTLRTLNSLLGYNALCSVGSSGWFTFTTEPTMIAACTLQNRNTPSWTCCEGEKVMALHLLDTPIEENKTVLVAASTKAVYQWILTGVTEPSLLRKFVIDGSIVAMESSRETFAVFDDKKQLALVHMHSSSDFEATFFSMPTQIRRGSVCFNRAGEGSCVLADVSDRLTMFQLKSYSKEGEQHDGRRREQSHASSLIEKPAATASAVMPPGKVKMTGSVGKTADGRRENKVIANLVNQLGLNISQTKVVYAKAPPPPPPPTTTTTTTTTTGGGGGNATNIVPPRPSSYSHTSRPVTAGLVATTTGVNANTTPTTMGENTTTTTTNTTTFHSSPITAPVARPALHNISLPQPPTDGVLAATVCQSEDEVREVLQRLESVITNTSQIIKLVPENIRRDHIQLVNLSLEAQITELQQNLLTPQLQKQSTISTKNSSGFETCVLMLIMDLLARNITSGVTRGVKEIMMSYFDHELRDSLKNYIGETQKQIIKVRLNDIMKETTTQFISQLKQIAENLIKNELNDVLDKTHITLNSLVKENMALKEALNDMMCSNLVSEIQNMREELKILRETIKNQESIILNSSFYPTNAFQSFRLLPETILTTTLSLIREQQQYRQGLDYILMANQPSLVLQLFTLLVKENNEIFSELIEDTTISNDIWCNILLQLLEAATVEEEKELIVSVAIDILSERDNLVQNSVNGAKFSIAMQALGKEAKANTSNMSFIQCLKNLEKLLQ